MCVGSTENCPDGKQTAGNRVRRSEEDPYGGQTGGSVYSEREKPCT